MSDRSRDRPATSHQLTIEADRLELHDHGDHLLLITPTQQDYWHGNCFALDAPPPDLAAWFARFPGSPLAARRHQLVRWETGWPAPPAPALPPDTTLELDTVMQLGELTAAPTPPAGIRFRPAAGERDWLAAAELIVAGGADGSSAYREFFLHQYREHRVAFARTGSTWWTAWDEADDTLVGSLGLYETPGWCRFRDVETRASHRRRGLASALIATAVTHARARAAARPIYMVARAGDDAERLYLRLGFRPVSAMFTVLREKP